MGHRPLAGTRICRPAAGTTRHALALLPAGLRLLITRGFEPSHSRPGGFRGGVRWLGIAVFRACNLHHNPTKALQAHCVYRPR
ncbi:hypothetical protein ABW45_15100 [Stenotrophomonas maltophilia]|nr:hypothetical protein ABW45_15100 [Stenotrophomonas maltophilia]